MADGIRTRKTKLMMYDNERNNIINELNIILDFNANNGAFFLCDLQNNSILIHKLQSLADDQIKKFFNCSKWAWYMSLYNGQKKDHVVLLKNIYKYQHYDIFSKTSYVEKNNIKKRYTKLFFVKHII